MRAWGLLIILLLFAGCTDDSGQKTQPAYTEPPRVDTDGDGLYDDIERESASEQTSPSGIILPLKKEDASSKSQGIWPYGIAGGDHPHGHPGIDFEADEGIPILAVDDGEIINVQEQLGEYKEETISLISDSLGKEFEIYYTGSMKNIQVKEGDRVKRGDIIAYFRPWEENNMVLENGIIHFEVFNKKLGKGGSRCPYEYMTEKAQQELIELHEDSKYMERDEFPLLCNPCPEGGCY